MARKTRTSKRAQYCADKAIQSSRNALVAATCKDMYKEFVQDNNRLPYGHVTYLLHELKPKETWVTRNIINKAFMKYRGLHRRWALLRRRKLQNFQTQSCLNQICQQYQISAMSAMSALVKRSGGQTDLPLQTKRQKERD